MNRWITVSTLVLSTWAFTACTQKEVAKKAPSKAAPSKAAPASAPAKAAPASQPAGATSSTKGTKASDRDQVDADGVVRRGVKLTDAKTLTIAELVSQADALNGKSVKVTGKISSACAKSGCWMVIQDEEKKNSIRITSKGYKYFVPKTSVGMTAIIEGDFAVKTLDQKTAQHYEDDKVEGTGKKAKKVEGDVKELAIASIGLELRK